MQLRSQIILVLILSLSCQQKKVEESVDFDAAQHFLGNFEQIERDTILLYDGVNKKPNYTYYKGKLLSGKDTSFFYPNKFDRYAKHRTELYACYQFDIDSIKKGLIARTPSEFSPNIPKIYLYSKKLAYLTSYVELFEMYSDTMLPCNVYMISHRDKKGNVKTIEFRTVYFDESKKEPVEDPTSAFMRTYEFKEGLYIPLN